jgi:hypothetical protein
MMTDTFKAVVYIGNEALYLADRDDPEQALEDAAFTPNPSQAQIFEGPGWADPVAGVGAVLERVS